MESAGAVEQTADGATDTVEDAASEEDRLRAEATKRLERRRRKMMSPEERLARITGRPVSQTSPTLESPPPLSGEKSDYLRLSEQVGSLQIPSARLTISPWPPTRCPWMIPVTRLWRA